MTAPTANQRPRTRRGPGINWVRRVTVVVAVTFAAIMGLSGVASADVIGEGPGVRARADWNWSGSPYSLTNIQLGVRDTACDGHGVTVQLRLFYQSGGSWLTDPRENHNGCGNAANWDTYYNANFIIAGVKVVGCVIDGPCYESAYHPRP
ncbi:hypothetical protein [Micromonospora sp. HUAS LYJ1]|uniref:hypothetical protein n=1 Tax=Micromonospora sp. HUAS LYJ1 TaxID=3061626 RepID=UPI00267374BE|nr:hypothetical protein [Micromonospora sp. HUAS LYJ1]WKU05469.1 hypothetical protein Q2K16_32840 [Micromonospora sp. HUAS LYJ1]